MEGAQHEYACVDAIRRAMRVLNPTPNKTWKLTAGWVKPGGGGGEGVEAVHCGTLLQKFYTGLNELL